MTDALLLVIVLGTVSIALAVDVVVAIEWFRRRWR